jgi:hypothetical protein
VAWIEQIDEEFNFNVPVKTARTVEKDCPTPITLTALGLLTNLLSYAKKWEVKKTELYKRFAFGKETKVKSAWKSLMDANYIVEYKFRDGKKWDYHYFVRKHPFSKEEKAQILAAAEKEYGEVWGLDFQDLKMKSSKSRGNQRSNRIKEELIIKDNNNNNDDDVANFSLPEDYQVLINVFRHELREEISDRSFNAVVRKVVDKWKQGKVTSFRDYLVTALSNKIVDLEFRRRKEKAQENIRKSKEQRWKETLEQTKDKPAGEVPFYNWLEE